MHKYVNLYFTYEFDYKYVYGENSWTSNAERFDNPQYYSSSNFKVIFTHTQTLYTVYIHLILTIEYVRCNPLFFLPRYSTYFDRTITLIIIIMIL